MKTCTKIQLSSLLFLLVLSFPSYSAVFTWNGSVGKWHNPENWDLNALPGPGDEVIINSGEPHVMTSETVNNVSVYGGTLNITSDGILNINNTIQRSYGGFRALYVDIYCNAIVDGILDIYIDPSISTGVNSQLIYNQGTIVNNNQIKLIGAESVGINCHTGGLFTNNASINIEDIRSGISNYSTFDNYGDIFMEGVSNIGISNNATFHNRDLATITINEFMGGIGIDVRTNSNFYNDGDLFIDDANTLSYGMGIHVVGFFENKNGATLSLSGEFNSAMDVMETGTFRNRSDMNVNNTKTYGHGIRVYGFFVNHQSGTIDSRGHYNISNTPDGELRNFGALNLRQHDSGSSYHSLSNRGVFSNRPKGKLKVWDNIINEPGAWLNNQGHMFCLKDGANHNIQGNFNNTAALGDVYDELNNINNTAVRIRPIYGTVEEGVPVSNALDIGGFGTVSYLSWYTTETGNTIAGTYDSFSNTFTPNANAVGLTRVYARIRITTGGVTRRHAVEIPDGVQPATPLAPSNKTSLTSSAEQAFDLNVQVYPNPVTERINIQFTEPIDGENEFRIYNAEGKTVHSAPLNGTYSRFILDLPSSITSGMYVLSVINNGVLLHSKSLRIQR